MSSMFLFSYQLFFHINKNNRIIYDLFYEYSLIHYIYSLIFNTCVSNSCSLNTWSSIYLEKYSELLYLYNTHFL